MSNWRVDTPYDMEEPPEILEIRAIIKIVDTRNLSDEESEKQYNEVFYINLKNKRPDYIWNNRWHETDIL